MIGDGDGLAAELAALGDDARVPKTDALARAALCVDEDEEDQCAGAPPWHLNTEQIGTGSGPRAVLHS